MNQETKSKIEEKFEKEFVVKSHAGTGILRYTDADKFRHLLLSTAEEMYQKGREESLAEKYTLTATEIVMTEQEQELLKIAKDKIYTEGYQKGYTEGLNLRKDYNDPELIEEIRKSEYQKGKEDQREVAIRELQEERQFIFNVLDGIDIADEQMGNKGGGTKAIRLALASRSLPKSKL